MHVVDELRKRKVAQWAAGYFAIAWGSLEVLGFVANQFDLPGGIVRSTTIILGSGFFIAIVLAWYHGNKGRQRITVNEAAWLIFFVVGGSVLMASVGLTPVDKRLDALAPAGPLTKLTVALPRDQRLSIRGGGSYPMAVSPDGTRIAYAAQTDSGIQLVVRPFDSFEATVLPGTADAKQPFFSPDGKWLAFFTSDALMKVPLDGGAPLKMATITSSSIGGAWGPDGRILYSLINDGLWLLDASGTERRKIELEGTLGVGVDAPNPASLVARGAIAWPSILPDGKHAIGVDYGGSIVFSLETGEFKRLIDASDQVRYVPTGHLIFTTVGEKVRAVTFDADRLEVTGKPFPVLEDVFRAPGGGAVLFDVSQNGTLAYATGGFARSLLLADRYGRTKPVTEDKRGFRFPRFSPDGQRVVVSVDPRPSQLWIYDIERGVGEKVTQDGHNLLALWRPDPGRILFWRDQSIYSMDPDSPDDIAAVYSPSESESGGFYPFTVNSNGSVIAGNYYTSETLTDVYAIFIAEDLPLRPIVRTSSHDHMPDISSDDRWIAYVSDRTGRHEVYVEPFLQEGQRVRVSLDGGIDPVWSKDGRELYFRDGEAIMAAAVQSGPTLAFSEPELLFKSEIDMTQTRNWDVSADGRFVLVESDPATMREFQVVLNWFSTLTD